MLQLTYTGPDALTWREAPEPRLSSDAAALVRPVAVATCDLDALIIEGTSPFAPPFAIGHECVAEVLEVGDAVGSLQPGRLVSVPFQISCGECPACRQGRTSNCSGVAFMSSYGFGPAVERWGGFLSDVVCVPYAEHMLVPIPDGLEPAAVASASDNISDAWRAVGPALAEHPGADVLVVGGAGPGSIGLYAAGLAVALGSESVLYVDADESRRQTAAALGAQTRAETPQRVGPYAITVDASAAPEGLALALRSTAPDGICTSTAIYFGEQPTLPLLEMYTKGITFKTGRANARTAMPHVLELAASGALHPELVTTRVVAWSDAAPALLERDWTKLVIER
ncbi:MAG TPA: alcohol dehydrogenase catalytic domain-containing protein [Solirubrobacteraceae bacterium]|jgi:threonine dehydrogenase-like Zn-dependent dehydrogenase|nr:alcohol dehydrogenase catalytic domain-containing protein [Solirubrobacteraceae bacterium]